jgi:hypothetical protein
VRSPLKSHENMEYNQGAQTYCQDRFVGYYGTAGTQTQILSSSPVSNVLAGIPLRLDRTGSHGSASDTQRALRQSNVAEEAARRHFCPHAEQTGRVECKLNIDWDLRVHLSAGRQVSMYRCS